MEELDTLLHVGTKDALRTLVRTARVTREHVAGRFVYCATAAGRRRQQLLGRRALLAAPGVAGPLPDSAIMPEELRAAIVLFFSVLDEKQRRLYAGLEALKTGRGGDARIAALLGLERGTRRAGTASVAGARRRHRPGPAGRRWPHAAGKKTPAVIARLEQLMQHDTAGDPMSGLTWTQKTTDKIAMELQRVGIHVGPKTVARLLKQMGYSLRVNHKKLARVCTTSPADRDAQFVHIAALREDCAARGLPVISVDTKKKELIGRFKNPGVAWSRTPVHVKDHDVRSEADGVALPYGIYDLHANRGTFYVGTSRATAAFAVDAIEAWWIDDARQRYPPCQGTRDLGGRRRQQRVPVSGVEASPAAATFRAPRAQRDRRPLPSGRIQVEPDRASTVQRDQQELGGTPPRQLRHHAPLYRHNHNQDRPHRSSPTS